MTLESVNRLAELSGRTPRTVKARLKSLTPVKQSGKAFLYESDKALPLIYDLGEESTPQRATTRLANSRANEIDHRLSISRGDFLPAAVFEYALSEIAGQTISILDSLPLRLKKKCPKLTARDVEFLRREIIKLQGDISKVRLQNEEPKK